MKVLYFLKTAVEEEVSSKATLVGCIKKVAVVIWRFTSSRATSRNFPQPRGRFHNLEEGSQYCKTFCGKIQKTKKGSRHPVRTSTSFLAKRSRQRKHVTWQL